jgi:hypothetical protein
MVPHCSYCNDVMPISLYSSYLPCDVYMTCLTASAVTRANEIEDFWLSVVAKY